MEVMNCQTAWDCPFRFQSSFIEVQSAEAGKLDQVCNSRLTASAFSVSLKGKVMIAWIASAKPAWSVTAALFAATAS